MKYLKDFLDYLRLKESLLAGVAFGAVLLLISGPIAVFAILFLYYTINYAPWLLLLIPFSALLVLGREVRNYIKETKE